MPYNYEEKQLTSIKEIEDQLENAKYHNLKNKLLLNLSKGLINSRKFVPYLLITGITFSVFSFFASVPFVKDTKRQNLWLKKEIDSNGNIAVEEQYEKIDNPSEISYISGWEPSSDGYYERKIVTYNIKTLNNEDIERIVLENDISLSSILGDPKISKVEKKNNVTEEELNQGPFIRAVIYDESLDRYSYIEESAATNNQLTIVWLLIEGLLCGTYALYDKTYRDYKLKDRLYELEDKYAPLDVNQLTRKLEIRKETYQRMK